MLLRELGEFGLIDRIRDGLIVRPCGVLMGIGDDGAVLRTDAGKVLVVSTDTLVEGVDFLYETISPEQLGHKSLAVNLSDIAAMGARPDHALVSLCIPDRYTVEYLTAFYEGIRRLAARFGVNVLGGDISSSPHDLVISITALGSARAEEVCYRHGARPGDALLVVGVLGESGAGLDSLLEPRQDAHALPEEAQATLRRRHLEPEPLVEEGHWLAESGRVHAMIDVSDGIASDLRHICRASGTGAVVERDALPITPALRAFLDATGAAPERYLLHTGEDYALLLAMTDGEADSLIAAFKARFATPITRIGHATAAAETFLRRSDGTLEPLSGGYEHFRRP